VQLADGGRPPLRAYLDGVRPGSEALQQDTLADPRQAERIETAILEHRRVRLLRLPSDRAAGRGEELRVWPLQLVLSGGLWHLAWEEDTIGRPHGLLQCERLERLQFLQAEPRGRRNESDHNAAITRLQRLLHHCGGTELGDDNATQQGLCQPSAEQRLSSDIRFWSSGDTKTGPPDGDSRLSSIDAALQPASACCNNSDSSRRLWVLGTGTSSRISSALNSFSMHCCR
jgi:hypothetical protein